MSSKAGLGVLIVDDSALIRSILRHVLTDAEGFSVIGEASNGQKACELNNELEPDVIIMDINMPVMNGLEATSRIMSEKPVPIVIFSNSVDAGVSFEALSSGALDIIEKPDIDVISSPVFLNELTSKIRLASQSARYNYPGSKNGKGIILGKVPPVKTAAVVIGASTGGPLAVKELLSRLPSSFPVGIAVVQHLEEHFDHGYAAWLDELVELKVRLAVDNDVFTPGEVLIAPVNRHLAVRQNRLCLEDTPAVLNQKPAVDVLFSTAAENYGKNLLGVLLTGMGRDGADGCLKILNKGGYTLVQDQSTSAIFGMPKAAIDAGAASEILPLQEIPERMISMMEGALKR